MLPGNWSTVLSLELVRGMVIQDGKCAVDRRTVVYTSTGGSWQTCRSRRYRTAVGRGDSVPQDDSTATAGYPECLDKCSSSYCPTDSRSEHRQDGILNTQVTYS